MKRRKSIRLKNYDYASAGHYFVTFCTQDRVYLFGNILEGKLTMNVAGEMVNNQWIKMSDKFENVDLDEYQIMPNHFHGIIIINHDVGAGLVPARGLVSAKSKRATTRVAPTSTSTLGDIVGAFKSLTTYKYVNGVRNHGWEPFNKRVWQRNYYERIIRNEGELQKIRKYIIENPEKWADDVNNLENR